jgi:cytoskeleton protein RodZ
MPDEGTRATESWREQPQQAPPTPPLRAPRRVDPDPPARAEVRYSAIAAILKSERERLGYDIGDVARYLRIRQVHLEAIESGRFAELPGPTYVTGFLRTYGEFLGYDPEDLISRYLDEQEGRRPPSHLKFRLPTGSTRFPYGISAAVLALLAVLGYGASVLYEDTRQARIEGVGEVPDRFSAILKEGRGEDGQGQTGSAAKPDPAPTAPALQVTIAPPAGNPPPVAPKTSASPVTSAAPGTPAQRAATQSPPPAANPAPPTPVAANTAAPLPTAIAPPPLSANPAPPAPVAANTAAPLPTAIAPPPPAANPAPPAPVAANNAATLLAVIAPPPPAARGEPVAAPSPPARTAVPAAGAPETPTVVSPPLAGAARGPLALIPMPPASRGAAEEQRALGTAGTRVQVRAVVESWVQILDPAGAIVFSRTLRPGDSYQVPDRQGLTLWTGNAGGIEIYLDGQRTVPLGQIGTVKRNVSLDPRQLTPAN